MTKEVSIFAQFSWTLYKRPAPLWPSYKHQIYDLSYVQYQTYNGKFPASFFSRNKPVAQTKMYLNAREVMELITLMPGEYLIVPSTFSPNETASFILTILSKAETHVQYVPAIS